jgi:hypothetical protein
MVNQHIKNVCLEDAANPAFSLGIGALYAEMDFPWQCEKHVSI